MPTPKIHISIANEVNKFLHYNNDSVLIGSILPDQTTTDHTISHYQKNRDGVEGVANADLFLKNKNLPKDIKVGYIIHLLTDSYFNIFIFNNYCVFDKDKLIGYRKKNKTISCQSDKVKRMKHTDCFTYENYLLLHDLVPKINSLDCLDKIKDFDNINFNKDSIKILTDSLSVDIDNAKKFNKLKRLLFIPRYNLVSTKEMNLFFRSCTKYIINYLEKNKDKI